MWPGLLAKPSLTSQDRFKKIFLFNALPQDFHFGFSCAPPPFDLSTRSTRCAILYDSEGMRRHYLSFEDRDQVLTVLTSGMRLDRSRARRG